MQDIAIVEPQPGSDPPTGQDAEGGTAAELEPCHCVLLRAGGQMSVLDMAQGGLALLRFQVWHVASTAAYIAGRQRFCLHSVTSCVVTCNPEDS